MLKLLSDFIILVRYVGRTLVNDVSKTFERFNHLKLPVFFDFLIPVCVFDSLQYGNFVDNLRLYVRGGSGGMGLPRLGGQGGKGGDVWVVATKNMTLKRIKDKFPQKRFVADAGANSG